MGASSGIGWCLCKEIVGRKGKLVISARRKHLLDEMQLELGDSVLAVKPFDLMDIVNDHDKSKQFILQTIKHYNVDTIVLNSGITMRAYSLTADRHVLDTMWDINAKSQIWFIQTAVQYWVENNIANKQLAVTSSFSGKMGSPGQAF